MTHLTEEQITAYERDGTVKLEGAFTDWVEPLTGAVMKAIAGHRAGEPQYQGQPTAYQNPMSIWENFGGGVMALNMVPHDPAFMRWIEESPAAELSAQVMRSKKVRYWVDATFLKDQDAASEGTPWHNDTCTWPFWGNQMVILWIALTDVGPENAPLTTVRGSHEGDGRYYSTFYEETNEPPPPPYKPWSELMAKTTAADAEILVHTMKAGDCLFMHPSTVHGSEARKASADAHRLAFSTRWLGDDVIFKPDPLTEPLAASLGQQASMVPGQPPSDEVMPPAWPR